MKKIKLGESEYDINHWDYFWNGSVLMAVVVVNRGYKSQLLDNIPKKYYNDILFSNHTVVDCGVRKTIPRTISENLKDKPYKLIKMDR